MQKRQELKWAGLSDVGRVRSANEDRWFVDPQRQLFIVADGMGGHLGGELAARIVVEVLPRQLRKVVGDEVALKGSDVLQKVTHQVRRLSQRVRVETAGEPGLAGMGATLVLALVRGLQTLVVHLGDSRAYLLRGGRLTQLTRDHSLVQALIDHGAISSRDARAHPAASQLTRYVGMEGDALPDAQIVDLRPADRLLLCTDGLSNMLDVSALEQILSGEKDPERACQALIDRANAAGGRDNVTAVVIAF
jgi:protein phosphatase